MQKLRQACQVPMVRTGVGRQTAILIVGFLGVASILRKVNRRSRHAQGDFQRAKAAHRAVRSDFSYQPHLSCWKCAQFEAIMEWERMSAGHR